MDCDSLGSLWLVYKNTPLDSSLGSLSSTDFQYSFLLGSIFLSTARQLYSAVIFQSVISKGHTACGAGLPPAGGVGAWAEPSADPSYEKRYGACQIN
jgi:hypothetical protein